MSRAYVVVHKPKRMAKRMRIAAGCLREAAAFRAAGGGGDDQFINDWRSAADSLDDIAAGIEKYMVTL